MNERTLYIYEMAYNEELAGRVREALADLPKVEEKKMFRGICFMVDDKMCICVAGQELLCRIGEAQVLQELESGICRQMMNNGRLIKDYVFVEDVNVQTASQLNRWISICLDFNPIAKSSKKK